ncbi:MAG: NAD(P)H-binding protein [Thermoplasmataceae archaeon]
MKTIVFGGSGFLGTNFIRSFGSEENAYYSRHRSKILDDFGAKWIEGSILDEAKVIEAVNGFDTVVVSVGTQNEVDESHFDLQVNGMKNVVKGIKKVDKDQKLIYISQINLEKGKTEYFRVKRVAEGNAQLVKNHLIVRPSNIFGDGDHLTARIINTAKNHMGKFPQEGDLSPVYVEDLVTVIKNSLETRGAINVSAKNKFSFLDCINTARVSLGVKPARSAGKLFRRGAIRKLAERSIFTEEEINRMLLNYYRDNTMLLDRYVKEPLSYKQYIERSAKSS